MRQVNDLPQSFYLLLILLIINPIPVPTAYGIAERQLLSATSKVP